MLLSAKLVVDIQQFKKVVLVPFPGVRSKRWLYLRCFNAASMKCLFPDLDEIIAMRRSSSVAVSIVIIDNALHSGQHAGLSHEANKSTDQ